MEAMTHAQRVNSNRLVDEFFDSIMIKYQYLDGVEPDLEYTLFGHTFRTPILGAALGLHQRFHESGSLGYAKGIGAAGSLNANGWIEAEQLEEICAAGIPTYRGVKPFADHNRIYQCIEHDEKCGAIAVCMDLDHIFEPNGKYTVAPYGTCGRQTKEDLQGYVKATRLPFIVKGVMTAEEAAKCADAGVGAIIVSNHNNRMPSAVPPLVALPEIKQAVAGACPILVDGGIETGVEAFKAFALGADGVMVARALMKEFSKGGPEAVTEKLNKMTEELAGCMANTCSASVAEIRGSSICRRMF